MSTSAPSVLFDRHGLSRTVCLNRPTALNALNLDMIRLMIPELVKYQDGDECQLIILKGTGRAFCAGGDVKAVVNAARSDDASTRSQAAAFFREEYQLDHLIATLRKPLVALLDGITMGGGVGISIHAPFRIATENTVFAMPETAIGLFPDVGGSFFLPRLDGYLGRYLALTGDRLKGQDVLWSGIATHFVPSGRLPALEERLQQLETADFQVINNAIEEFAGEVDIGTFKFGVGDKRKTIDSCFSRSSVEEIYTALEADGTEFAVKALSTMQKMSPTSLKVTLKQLETGESLGIRECFMMEYRMATRAAESLSRQDKSHDFFSGVDALLISKTGETPSWSPGSLAQVSSDDVNWYFAPLEDNGGELEFLNSGSYQRYPYNTGLPSEREIVGVFERLKRDRTSVDKQVLLDEFKTLAAKLGGPLKRGLEQKLGSVVDSKFSSDSAGNLSLSKI